MTSPIKNAIFSTQAVVKDRTPEARSSTDDRGAAPASNRADRADLGRAQQLLSQQTEHGATAAAGSPIHTMAEARERMAALKQAIQADPSAAVKAHGLVNGNIFVAASARPSA